jgi:hypothetical protein
LRKEGKLLSKSEKERRVKAEMQLQALEAQGIHIPQKGETGSTKKGPVRYGSRTRKPKQQQQTSEMILEGEEEETESMTTDYSKTCDSHVILPLQLMKPHPPLLLLMTQRTE